MLLKGYIYWVNDDFKYSGERKFSDQFHSVVGIENVSIKENSISFDVPEYISNGNLCIYKVALDKKGKKNSYKGFYKELIMDDSGEISCKLFSNKKQIMLYGDWIEYGKLYTWWAIINKV